MTGSRLKTRLVEKPWGRADITAPFRGDNGARIGEIWFEPPAELASVLVKLLFTSENLSVQNHPSDAASPTGRGKDECWLVLDAEPGARIAIGLKQELPIEQVRRAALDGSLDDLLEWHEAKTDDFFYVPAGTIHAIGAGLTLVEVQQNSDVTYRLFDYGRPRELHLDEGLAVALNQPYDEECRRSVGRGGSEMLVDGPHFRLAQISGACPANIAARYPGPVQLVVLEGSATLDIGRVEAGNSAWTPSIANIEADTSTRWLAVAPV